MLKLEKTEYLIANQKLDIFSEKQKLFWDILFDENSTEHPIDNAQVNYEKFRKLKSNLWGGELIYDNNGSFCDFELRQIGDVLAEHYGQRKNQYLIDDYSKNSFRDTHPTYHYRFTRLIDEILEERKPLLTLSHYLENNKKKIDVSGLIVPITKDTKTINAIIGYTDISVNEPKN